MDTSLRLIAATPDMHEILTRTLAEHGVGYRSQGKMVVVENAAEGLDGEQIGPERVLALLRDALSAPEREDVSVVEELDFPQEFPVTTRLEAWWAVFETSWFEKAVSSDAFSVWFQPVVDTTARRIIGHECLLRVTKGHRRDGAEIMTAAAARRDLRGFDAYTRQLAIRAMANQRSRSLCFLNFLPSTIYRPAFCLRETLRVLEETGLPPGNFVMEAVESNCRPDIPHLRRIADYLHEQGMGFALDDVGANAEALRLVCELRPDYIKLEKRLVHRMEEPRQAAAVRKLVEVAESFGVRVIAKGVERVSTMEQLREAGIQCMQGYLLGSPVPEIAGTSMDLVHLARAIPRSADETGYAASATDGAGVVDFTSQAFALAEPYYPPVLACLN
jgi:EAL domain-containing protein (putative c-di-GMP-specific phosphodiesterase class I)